MTKIRDFSHLNTPSFRAGLAQWAAKYRAENNLEEFYAKCEARGQADANFDRAFAAVRHAGNSNQPPIDLLASAPPVPGAAGWDKAFAGVHNPFNKASKPVKD